jgi:hypothetical protein
MNNVLDVVKQIPFITRTYLFIMLLNTTLASFGFSENILNYTFYEFSLVFKKFQVNFKNNFTDMEIVH